MNTTCKHAVCPATTGDGFLYECTLDILLSLPSHYGVWQPISTLKIGGAPVLLYTKEWIDEDFNPKGIREGFRNESDDGPIFSARWNDCGECWETVVNYEATHWTPQPDFP